MLISLRSTILTLFAIGGVSSALAGTATLTGYGETVAPVEYVTLNVTVTSECYPTAKKAVDENDAVASSVLSVLKTYAVESQGDQVTATGGYVERYTGHDPSGNRQICVNQFKKQNILTLKTHSVDTFPQAFAKLQDALYSLTTESVSSVIDKPISHLEISVPMPGLSLKSKSILEKKALVNALQDAKNKFTESMSLAGVSTYTISSYTEDYRIDRPYYPESGKSSGVGSMPAPVQFGFIKIAKSLSVQFNFEGQSLNMF